MGPLLTFPPRESYGVDDLALLPHGVELIEGHLRLDTDINVEQVLSAYADSPTTELIKGSVIVSPAPHPRHADAAHDLVRWIEDRVDSSRWKVRESINVRLDERTLLIPGVAVYAAEAMTEAAWIPATAVALAVEIPSPGEFALRKVGLYLAAGVGAVWSVDLTTNTIDTAGRFDINGDPRSALARP